MTKLQREKYLLSLNNQQRLALLLTLGLHLQRGNTIDMEAFEYFMKIYKPEKG